MAGEGRPSRRQRAAREAFKADVKAALLHPPTRRLLGAVFDLAGVYDLPPLDPTAMAVATGRREVGLRVRAMIDEVDPLAFVALEAEAVNRRVEMTKLAKVDKEEADAADPSDI